MTKHNKKTQHNSKKTSSKRRRRRKQTNAYGTNFESLEERKLLAAITVGTAADLVDGNTSSIANLIASPGTDGAISLREAIAAAESTSGLDTITFDASTFNGEAADVIRLQSPLLVSDSTAIDAGNLGVVVSGDTLGNDVLVAGSFVADVEANDLAGTFADNTDGVFVFSGSVSQDVTLSGLTITSGDSSARGGGVLVSNFANLTITQSTIAGNRAAVSGGGVQSDTGSLTIDRSTISGNVAHGNIGGQGGGIHAIGGSLALTNSTVSGNSANATAFSSTAGGGIFWDSPTVSIVSSTITDNSAGFGGGIANNNNSFAAAPVFLNNSIVAGNSASILGPDLVSSFTATYDTSFSLIGNNSGSTLTASPLGVADANGNFIGTSGNVIDPQLQGLADNGGPTLTHAIFPTSPASEAGNSTLGLDQRGVARAIGGDSDIGAVELDGAFIIVDSSVGFADGNISPGNLTLHEAIDISNSTPEIETIVFDPTVFDGEQQDVINLTSTLRIFDAVTIDAFDLGVVISGDAAGNDGLAPGTFITSIVLNNNDSDNVRVFESFASAQSVVTLSGLTITGGNASFADGGGILSNGGSLVIEDSLVAGNVAGDTGGGIHANTGSVIITGSSIDNNRSESLSSFGGGGGVGSSAADVTLFNSSVTENFAESNGGGVHSENGNLAFINSTISDNRSDNSGGGISSINGDIAVTRSTVSTNSAGFNAGGGGIINGSGVVTVSNSTISGNVSGRDGSGIQTFEGALTITDSTITRNRTNNFGGAGVWADYGFGFTQPSLTVRNSIIADNLGSFGNSDLELTPSATVDITSSLIGSNFNTSLVAAPLGSPDANGNFIGTISDPINPLLDDLADNGGPTATHALLEGSPAIDAGISFSTTDQRGETRPLVQPSLANSLTSNGSDIGAFEFQSLILTVDSSVDLVDGNFSPGNLSLREAITLVNDNPGTEDVIRFSSTVFDGQPTDVIRLQLGELQITEGVTIDAGNSNVVVSADALGNDIVDPVTFITDVEATGLSGALGDNGSRVFNIATALGEDVTFTGLTITGGTAATGGGGGINVSSANLGLVDTSVSGNLSFGNGGGVLSDQGLTFTDSTISQNIAASVGGGGGIAVTAGNVTLNNSTVSDNRGTGVGGGGILAFAGDVLLNSSDVIGNVINGASGGGISTDSGTVTLNSSSVSGNESSAQGGGISTGSGAVTLNASTVSGNRSSLQGGGVSTNSGAVALDDSTVSDNESSFQGGGIWTDSGAITVNGSTVSGNDSDSAGGGIWSLSGIISLSNSTLSDNNTTAGTASIVNRGGGGIFAGTGDVSVSSSTVSGNSTSAGNADGGSISTASGNVTITRSTISGNSVLGASAVGGAIATDSGTVTITSSTISGNSTLGDYSEGGAIATFSGNFATTGSTFSGNSTQGFGSRGGVVSTKTGNITTTSSTFSGNSTAGAYAGGGAIATNTGEVTIVSSTITENSNIPSSVIAGEGGGGISIFNTSYAASLTIQNSIIAGNSAVNGNDLLINSSVSVNASSSLIGDNSGTSLTATTVPDANGNLIGSSAAIIDPMLDVLADNGGATQTRSPLPGSPAIDAGSSGLASDQRGAPFVRTDGTAADIGAFETQILNLVVGVDTDISNGDLSLGDLTLREAIEVANSHPGEDLIRFSPGAFRGITSDTIHLTQGALTITESVTIDGEELGVVISGDSSQDDINLSGTAITNLANNTDTRLDDNSGVFNITAAAGETITLSALTITGGIGIDGGGIRNEVADLVIERSTIAGNRASGNGGAIFNDTGSVTINTSTISGNETTGDNSSGGGVHTDTGAITINNSTLSGNSSTGLAANGGGVSAASGDVTLDSATVTDNSATGEGGGVFVADSTGISSLTINNTIVAGNTGNTSPDLQFDSSISFDVDFSLIGDNSGTPLSAAAVGSPDANGNLIGTVAAVIDPLLGALADNAGLTFTHRPLDGSPATDAGGPSTLTTDQRDLPLVVRDNGNGVDIGAFERFEFRLVVDTTSDIDDGDLSVGNLSLREAVAVSNINSETDTITFDPSVFNPQMTNVIRLQLGELTISDGVLIDAEGAGVVISGDRLGNDVLVAGSFITDRSASTSTLSDNQRVINITAGAGEVVSITGITITGGSATDSFDNGGGIQNQNADLVLTDTTVAGNRTGGFGGDGGGISTANGPLTLNNSIVSDNFSDSDGGGIYSSNGNIELNSSNVIGNSSEDNGAGIYANGNVITLNDSSVANNTIVDDFALGGGIYSLGADLTLNNSDVTANTTGRFGDGAGINTSSGDVTLNNSSVSDNSTGLDSDGGGIRTSSGDITIDRSTISGNQSSDNGGGISTNFGEVVLRNSTVSGNQTGGSGGGISHEFGELINIINSTITNNQSDGNGGGIHDDSTSSFDEFRIQNSIVAGNISVNGIGDDLFYTSGIVSSINNSLIGSNAGTPLQAALVQPDGAGNLVGTDAAPIDPLLGALADNGGPTLTHALLAGSPAIGAGGTPSVSIGNTDQRGEPRILDGQIDIGSFEFSPSAFLLGDVNQDGIVDFSDISPFISILQAGGFLDEADVNRDGVVDFADISFFIDLLIAQ